MLSTPVVAPRTPDRVLELLAFGAQLPGHLDGSRQRGRHRPGHAGRACRLEPRLVTRRQVPLLLQQPRGHDEPLACGDRRGDRNRPGRSRAGHVVSGRPHGDDHDLARRPSHCLPGEYQYTQYLQDFFRSGSEAVVGEPLAVTSGSRRAMSPNVSPDDQWVAFSFFFGGGQADIAVIRTDGTGLRQLTDEPHFANFRPAGLQTEMS